MESRVQHDRLSGDEEHPAGAADGHADIPDDEVKVVNQPAECVGDDAKRRE